MDKPDMSDVRSGRPDYAMELIFLRVGRLAGEGHFHQKVGITNKPQVRWNYHKAAGWKSMTVVYRHEYRECVQYVERRVVRYFNVNEFEDPGYAHNIAGGGEGRLPQDGPNFVYLLGAPRFNRFTQSIWL